MSSSRCHSESTSSCAIGKLTDKRKPYPLSWAEQNLLLSELEPHAADLALFMLNSGAREQEACKLEWDWDIAVPELDTSVFVVPAEFGGRDGTGGVKNGEDRLIVMNSVARSIIDGRRGKHKRIVFASPRVKDAPSTG